jgi:hypothetical protein
MKNPRFHNPVASVCAALLLVAAAAMSGIGATSLLSSIQNPQVAAAADAFPQPLALNPSALQSDAAVVIDPKDGTILFAKNSAALPLATVLDVSHLATTTETTQALHALGAIPGIVRITTYGLSLPEPSLRVVFDVEIGHPLVAVVLGGTAESRIADVTSLISAHRR